jgi:hypothetical protein
VSVLRNGCGIFEHAVGPLRYCELHLLLHSTNIRSDSIAFCEQRRQSAASSHTPSTTSTSTRSATFRVLSSGAQLESLEQPLPSAAAFLTTSKPSTANTAQSSAWRQTTSRSQTRKPGKTSTAYSRAASRTAKTTFRIRSMTRLIRIEILSLGAMCSIRG